MKNKKVQPTIAQKQKIQKNKRPYLFHLINVLILALSTLSIYSSSFDNQFVNWDDQVYVEEQPLVINKDYSALWKTPVSLNYHPITMVSLAAQTPKNIKQLSPKPFIQLNVWLHICNALLVYLLIFLISGNKMLPALLTALIFALHPMHVESVVWISERKDVLYTFSMLLSCIFYWKYLEQKTKTWLMVAGLFFLFSVLSKAMGVVIPLLWLLMDYWKNRPLYSKNVWLEKIPFLSLALFFGLMAVSVQSGGDFGGILHLYGEKAKAVADLGVFSVWQRFQFASYGFIKYIYLFFNPQDICAFYPYPSGDNFSTLEGFLYPFLFLLTLGLAIFMIKKQKVITFGISFYFITVALVLQFISVGVAIMADRYTYVPYIGIAFLCVYLLTQWAENKDKNYTYSIASVIGIFIILLSIKTKKQVEVWQNSETLWTQVLQYFPTEDLALANRGNNRGKTGNIEGAMVDFEKAISDGCTRADVYEGLGNSYGTLSERQPNNKVSLVTKAIEMYQKALELDPSKGNIHYNLGIAQLQTNPSASVVSFEKALAIMPYKENEILPILGLSLLNSTKYQEAIDILSKGIQIGVLSETIYYHRGLAYMGLNNRNSARVDFEKALTINPNNQEILARKTALGL